MSSHEVPDVPVWAAVLDELTDDERVTPQLQGFLNLAVAQGVMGGTLYLDVPNDLTAAQFTKRMRTPIMEALARVDQESQTSATTFRVVVNPELADAHLTAPVPVQSTAPPVPPPMTRSSLQDSGDATSTNSRSDTRLNPKYTFDNFVIGQSNRFAHAAAVAVAEAPAKAYNPLFIYGDSGLGKTHLLHAIGDYAMSLYTGIRVRYVSSEEFTNDFINSIANNRGSAFQARYRDVDILLIDDIQFLQGRAETQEAFFHTFNTLHDHDKQVVITSDVPPKHLTGFEDRMRSRFEWGLITDVQAPDLETRIAILRKKAQSERLHIPDEVLEYIATVVSSNIRELEGALIRVSAFASLNRSTLDMSLAQSRPAPTLARGAVVDSVVEVSVPQGTPSGSYEVTVAFGAQTRTLTVRAFPRTAGPDLARAGTASSSADETPDFPAAAANDGDPATRWSSPVDDGAWWQVQLAEPVRLGRLVLTWQDAHPSAYRVQVSADGRVWRTATTVNDSRGGRESLRFDERDVRYVRVQGMRRATAYGYSLWSVEAYAVAEETGGQESAAP